MDWSFLCAEPRKVLSFKVALYSLPCGPHSELYLDRRAAIELARTIDGLRPRPNTIDMLYTSFHYQLQQQPSSFSPGQMLLDRLIPAILQPVADFGVREMYRVPVDLTLQYIGSPLLEWEVSYMPGEEYDVIRKEIGAYILNFIQPVQAILDMPLVLEQENSFTRGIEQVESGFTTPECTPEKSAFRQDLDLLMLQSLDPVEKAINSTSCVRKRAGFPSSQFSIADTQHEQDLASSQTILNMVKVLVIDSKAGSKHHWSLGSEKAAIRSMSLEASLNIANREWTNGEKLHRLFERYNKVDEEGNVSFQQALLMVLVRLFRHDHMYESGPKKAGNYAGDFDSLYPFLPGYMKRGGQLCRIIVACGHPCILLVLVRLAIRNRFSLAELIQKLPIPQFCQWVAGGKVSDSSNLGDDEKQKNLLWLHTNALLPLLNVASVRVPAQLYLLNGTLRCDQETCLRAIVHSTRQVKYAQFLLGHFTDSDWQRGKVLVESKSVDEQVVQEYSVEKERRTIHRFDIASYANSTEHFDDPPRFLKSQTLKIE